MEIVILVSLLSLYCDFTDAECPVISPARLVVKYGDPASSNCSLDTPAEMGWEATQGGTGLTDKKVKFLNWRVDSVTDWNNKPRCYTEGGQCEKQLDITVYKLPDSVSISYRKYPDPMVEGHQYQLQCHVQNIAAIERLRVTFYKVNTTGEQTELDTQQNSKDNIKTPVNRIYTLDFTPSRDDDGAQLWCSAMLDLGPEGPQPPPVMKSDNLNITVHYKPLITMSPERFSMSITEGDTLSLNCSAKGKPAPSYDWLLPHANPNTMKERSVVTITNVAKTHSGNYTCNARNPLGNSIWTVNVKVTDAECPVISPARLVVKYGHPASSNCSLDTPVAMGWKATQGGTGLTDKKVKFLNWRVDSVTTWNNKPKCYTDRGQCQKQLDITVYKLPDSVSMTGPSGPMVEGKEYEFKCLIQNVAPINSLNVSFYKTSTIGKKTLLYAADVARQTTKEPISGEYPLLWSPSRGDDGAQLWCSALLGLGELGPQPPPEMESEPFNLSVPSSCQAAGSAMVAVLLLQLIHWL